MKQMSPLSKPLMAIVFCFLLLAAAILSYYSAPQAGNVSPLRVESADEEDIRNEEKRIVPVKMDEEEAEGTHGGGLDAALPGESKTELIESVAKTKEQERQGEAEEEKVTIDMNDEACKASRRNDFVGVTGGPRFQYVHVPKTGGTSVQTAMISWVQLPKRRAVLLKYNGANFGKDSFLCPPGAMDATMLMGHRGWGFCTGVENHPRGLFTFVTIRKGASRIISLYDYNIWRQTRRALHIFGTTPLNTWVRKFNATPEVELGEWLLRFSGSQQVRYICGYECMGENARHNKTINLAFMMKRAKENLLKTSVIGLTEELDASIDLLKFHLPWLKKRFTKWPEANEMANFKKSEVDDDVRTILEEWGRPDQELYEFAKVLYDRQLALVKRCMKKEDA